MLNRAVSWMVRPLPDPVNSWCVVAALTLIVVTAVLSIPVIFGG